MQKNFIGIQIEEGELKDIFEELTKAQETIYKCYNRLQQLGVLTIKKSPSGNDD